MAVNRMHDDIIPCISADFGPRDSYNCGSLECLARSIVCPAVCPMCLIVGCSNMACVDFDTGRLRLRELAEWSQTTLCCFWARCIA